jgi:cation diffusion facilitator family transporter
VTSRRVVALTVGLNLALCVASFVVWHLSGSKLVLAQGADSLMDLAVGAVLIVSVRVAGRPSDVGHPFGHQRAEPIGALVASVLAFVLAIEVARAAGAALVNHETAAVDAPVFALLGSKLALKLGLLIGVLRHQKAPRGQAVHATRLDTLNDVITTGSSLVGAWLARRGWPSLDSWFALPVAAYIGFNGFMLARESIRYLMGEAPDDEVRRRLETTAASCQGVLKVRELRAHFVGATLHVEVVILIPAGASAKQGHDIAIDVQQAVARDPLVGEVFVHIDTGEGKDGT